MTPTPDILISRIEALEAASRRQRWALVAALLGCALLGGMALRAPRAYAAADALKCSKLVVEDDAGKPRIALQVLKSGPNLTFFDAAGKARMTLTSQQESGDGKLGFIDDSGVARATFGVHKGMPALFLYDTKAKVRTAVYSLADGGKGGIQLIADGKVTKTVE